MHPDDLPGRRDAVAVQHEHEIVARRREAGVGRRRDVDPVDVRVNVSVFARWPVSKAWVTEPMWIHRTSVIWAAFGVTTENVPPYVTSLADRLV